MTSWILIGVFILIDKSALPVTPTHHPTKEACEEQKKLLTSDLRYSEGTGFLAPKKAMTLASCIKDTK